MHQRQLQCAPPALIPVIPVNPEHLNAGRAGFWLTDHTRQGIEHVIRRVKIFRVLKGVYRHRRRRFALRVQLIAALCNLTQACPS